MVFNQTTGPHGLAKLTHKISDHTKSGHLPGLPENRTKATRKGYTTCDLDFQENQDEAIISCLPRICESSQKEFRWLEVMKEEIKVSWSGCPVTASAIGEGAPSEVQKPHLLNRKEHDLCTKLDKRTEGGGCLGCCGSTRRHTGPKETAR